jgi:multisubunit Na+/H+ antiporter MnhG subunit
VSTSITNKTVFITGPTSSHAVANAALVSGAKPSKKNQNKIGDEG